MGVMGVNECNHLERCIGKVEILVLSPKDLYQLVTSQRKDQQRLSKRVQEKKRQQEECSVLEPQWGEESFLRRREEAIVPNAVQRLNNMRTES